MSTLPTYSVIIPHFNNSQLLKRAVNSVPERQDIELLIIDDCSTAEHINDLKLFLQTRACKLFFLTEKRFGGGARNIGIQNATGKYLLFLDCDDFFEQDAFHTFDQAISNESAELILFRACSFLEGTNKLGDRHLYLIDLYKKKGLSRYLSIASPCAKLFSKAMVDTHKLEFSEVPLGDDILFSTKTAILAHQRRFVDQVVYQISQNPASITQSVNDVKLTSLINEQTRRVEFIKSHTSAFFSAWYLARRNYLPKASKWLAAPETSAQLRYASNQYINSLPSMVRCFYKCRNRIRASVHAR